MKSIGHMARGLGKTIGNGKTTEILNIVWADGRSFQFKQSANHSSEPKPIWISDLILEKLHLEYNPLKEVV